MSTLRLGLSLLVAALCGVEQLLGQTVAWITTGFPGRRLYAWDMRSAGDVDQDGIEDILCGVDAPCSNPCQKSVLWFLSGANGSLIREVVAPAALGACFGSFSSAGFVNGDSVPDYIAIRADIFNGVIGEVRDGLTNSVLWTFPGQATGGWGWSAVLGDLDLNGDGNKDFLAASYQASELRAYSHGGALLYTLQGLTPGPSLPPLGIGLSLVKLGDVDDDGRDDFAMGASDPSGRGGAVVVSGATGQFLRICYGELPGDILGFYITDCGDLDGDGYVDFAVGNGGTPAVSRGVVRVFSSRTGAVLRQWTKSANFLTWSSSMSSRGVDLDGDGLGDMLISYNWAGGGPGIPGGIVYTYSGRDGSQIHEINGQSAQGFPQAGTFGTLAEGWAFMLRPRAGERIGHAVIPNTTAFLGPGSTPNCVHMYGALVAYHGLPRTAATIGPACAGNLTRPPNIGMASLGVQGVRIHLSNASPNSTALLLLGLSTTQFYGVPLPLPLDAIGLPGCQLRTAVEIACTAVAGTVGTAAGHTQLDLPIPVTTAVQGAWTVSAQWWVLGDAATFPGGMSQALRWDY